MELRTYLRILLKKWWLVLPIFLLTLAATAILTVRQQPMYEANATYVVKLNTFLIDDKNFVSALDILSRRTEISTTYAEIAKSRHIKTLAANSLDLSEQERKNVSVDGRLITGTNLLEISAQAPDRALTVEFVNAVGTSTQAYVDNLYEVYELEELDPPTTSSSPTSPRTVLNLAIGAIAGLVLGIGMALLATYLEGPFKAPVEPVAEPQPAGVNGVANPDLQRELVALQGEMVISRERLDETETKLGEMHTVAVETRDAIRHLIERLAEGNDGFESSKLTPVIDKAVSAYDYDSKPPSTSENA